MGKMSFIKKHKNIFGNKKYKDFTYLETMREEIKQTFNEKLLALDPNGANLKGGNIQ